MSSRKTLNEVQAEFDKKFPNSNITIVQYLGANREGLLSHPDYGQLSFSRYYNLMRFSNSEDLLNTLVKSKLNRPSDSTSNLPVGDLTKILVTYQQIHSLSSDTSLSDSDFRQQVVDLLRN